MKALRTYRASDLWPQEPCKWHVGSLVLVAMTYRERLSYGSICGRCPCKDGSLSGCCYVGNHLCMLADAMDPLRYHTFIKSSELPKGIKL